MFGLLQFGGKGLMYWMDEGGWVMWPIAFLMFLATVIMIERAIVFVRARTNTAELMAKVRSQVLENRLDDAVATCDASHGAVAHMFKAALLRRAQGADLSQLERVMENTAITEIARLERGLWILSLITGLAPILGFLGTVVGMIASFDVIAAQGMNNPGAVAEGISVALITTAAGLIVATPTIIAYNFFMQRISNITNEMETAAIFLQHALQEAGRSRSAA